MTTLEAPAAFITDERYERPLAPPDALRPWITGIGHIPTLYDLPPAFTRVPDTATTIVLRTEPSGRRDAFVVGPQTRAAYTAPERPAGCTRLRLTPGATRPLLGLSATDLTDRMYPLGAVPGVASEFADQLTDLDADEVLTLLETQLPQRLTENRTQRHHRRLLADALDAMAAGTESVPALAARLAVSERQLRILFTAGIGLSPKHFARITRLRRLLAETGETTWSERAAAAGFYDQSHMTAEFRTLMGVTPGRFLRGELPGSTGCRALGSATR